MSSITGYYIFSNRFSIHLIFLFAGVFFLAAGSAALNQYTEREADAIMERTKNRSIPSHLISEKTALLLAIIHLIAGSFFLFFNGLTPLLLGLLTVLLYNFFYTRLKKTTVLSIIPGALVGAFPPMIGFTSAGGIVLHQNIILFSVFMFLWQLPHFWLIIINIW